MPRRLAAPNENDRSATGYSARAEFEAVADSFFADPHYSVRGWEKAIDGQRRIVAAIETVVAATSTAHDVAVVSHGAVGALLLCWLKRCPISRMEDHPGTGGGHYFCFDSTSYALRHGWRTIEDPGF